MTTMTKPKLSAKEKMLNVLKKETGTNTFSVAQAQAKFKIANVSARISDLRKDGHNIQTIQKLNKATKAKVAYYKLAA